MGQTNNTLYIYRWLIVGVTIIGALAALLFAIITPVQYDTSIAFFINRTNIVETTEYQFDGYYAIQASDLFSQTVMSWFLTPSVLLEIYDRADIDPQISSIEEITSRFKTRKYSPQNVVVRYQERDRETADKIAWAIIDVVQEKAAAANQTADEKALFEVMGGAPVIVEDRPHAPLNTVIGLVAGFVLSIVVAYSVAYIRQWPAANSTEG